jgi:hypothetical protein
MTLRFLAGTKIFLFPTAVSPAKGFNWLLSGGYRDFFLEAENSRSATLSIRLRVVPTVEKGWNVSPQEGQDS